MNEKPRINTARYARLFPNKVTVNKSSPGQWVVFHGTRCVKLTTNWKTAIRYAQRYAKNLPGQ